MNCHGRRPILLVPVAQLNHRVANLHFRVHDFSIRHWHAALFDRSERLNQKIDELRRVANQNVRRDRAEPLAYVRNRFLRFAAFCLAHHWFASHFFLQSFVRLFENFVKSPLHFLRRHIFLMRSDNPGISKRIRDLARTLAVKLILHRPHELCPGCQRFLRRGVCIGDHQLDPDCGTAQRFRAHRAKLRILVRKHDSRVANLYLRGADFLIRINQAHGFLRSKNALVKFNRSSRILETETRNHRGLRLDCPLCRFSRPRRFPYQLCLQRRFEILARQSTQFARNAHQRRGLRFSSRDRRVSAVRQHRVNRLIQFFVQTALRHFSSPVSFLPSVPFAIANSVSRGTATASPRLPTCQSLPRSRVCFSLARTAFQSPTAAPSATLSPCDRASPARRSLQNRILPLFLCPDSPSPALVSAIYPP